MARRKGTRLIMASVYKRTCDRKRKNAPYYITYTDHDGKRRMRKGFTDKATTERLAAKLDHEVMLRKRGLIDPVQEGFANNRSRPIGEHIDAFEKHLKNRQNTTKYVGLMTRRVRRLVAASGVASLNKLTKELIEETLANMQVEQEFGSRTFNHYIQALDSFGRWLMSTRRTAANPFVGLPLRNVEIDIRHKRRALTLEEATKLIEAANSSRKIIQGYTGPERARAYYFSFMTGLRRREMASLKPKNFDLNASPPIVRLAAACSKHRREDVLPLHEKLVADLRIWFAGMQPDQLLFPRLERKKTWFMVKRDLAVAGIPYETEEGIADFHAAGRHSHVTELFRTGGSPTEVRQLARHSDIRMTMRYTHVGINDQARALSGLESPSNGHIAVEANGHADKPKPVVKAAVKAIAGGLNGNGCQRISTDSGDFSGHLESPSGGDVARETAEPKSEKPVGDGLSDARCHRWAAGDNPRRQWRRRESNPRPAIFPWGLLRA